MSKEIENRLKDCSDNCIAAYSSWCEDQKDHAKREALSNTLHELRKVCARLEIEMAASEREEQKASPLPIPPHKAARGGNGLDAMPEENPSQDVSEPPKQSRGGTRRGSGGGRRRNAGS